MTFRSFLALACCAAAFMNSALAAPRPGDSQLRDDLDVAYNTWRLHMLRGNYDGWRATTSAYRQVKVRNLAVSEKLVFIGDKSVKSNRTPGVKLSSTDPYFRAKPIAEAIRKAGRAVLIYSC